MRKVPLESQRSLLVRHEDAAHMLGISTSTLRAMVRSGEIEPVRIHRSKMLRRADVERLVEEGTP
jgi:excisionase family DNA binding protein